MADSTNILNKSQGHFDPEFYFQELTPRVTHVSHHSSMSTLGLDTTALPNWDGGSGAARPLADGGHVCACGNVDGTL